jgi:hypothetical protein
MTFPAWDAFDGDLRVNPRHLRVYRWCRMNLDFQQVRYGKRDTIAMATHIKPPHIGAVLDDLVRWGFLDEHPKEPREPRRFTLLFSKGTESVPISSADEGRVAA